MTGMLRFELQGLDAIQKAYAKAPVIFDEEAKLFLDEITLHLVAEVVDRTPTRSGLLRSSMAGTVQKTPLGWSSIIGTPLDYAPPVELGSKPHEIRPKNKKALAFNGRVVKVVHHPGTKGAFMFKRTVEANSALVQERSDAAVARITQRMGGPA